MTRVAVQDAELSVLKPNSTKHTGMVGHSTWAPAVLLQLNVGRRQGWSLTGWGMSEPKEMYLPGAWFWLRCFSDNSTTFGIFLLRIWAWVFNLKSSVRSAQSLTTRHCGITKLFEIKVSLNCRECHSDPPCLEGPSRACYLNELNFESSPISTECDSYLALPSEHLSSKYSASSKSLDFSLKKKLSGCLTPSTLCMCDFIIHSQHSSSGFWSVVYRTCA